MTDARPPPSTLRYVGAAIGVTVATLDIVAADTVGVVFVVAETDVRWFIWSYLAVSLGGLGFVIGQLVDARRAERRQAAELADARARLAENTTLAALGQMASTVAHEVRNPLAVVRSTVQTVRDDLGEGGEAIADAWESCTFALDEIDRLDRVVDGVLDLARPLRATPARIAVADLFARVDGLAERLLDGRGVRSRCVHGAEMLFADADLTCQALLGLVANAADAAPTGTVITLEAREVDDGVELSVSDRGPGVPAEMRGRIFEPFFTTRVEGTGLGLAVVRQIARAHGGRVSVGDADDGGARFALILPRTAPVEARP